MCDLFSRTHEQPRNMCDLFSRTHEQPAAEKVL